MSKRILIVDDDAALLRAMRRTLDSLNYEIYTAGSVAEALAAPGPWDGLIVDEGLPDGSGQWVADHYREVPHLTISGLPGADLPKPFLGSDLRDAVARLVGA